MQGPGEHYSLAEPQHGSCRAAACAPRDGGHFDPSRLEAVFEQTFAAFHTRLRGGFDEPLYRPGKASTAALIAYRSDYFASALHEVAHWCIAGEARRQQEDYGYWYLPDGRDADQQARFEAAEVEPQALEWIFAKACAYPFRVSSDNISADSSAAGIVLPTTAGSAPTADSFAARVGARAETLVAAGLPARAAAFYHGLCREFHCLTPLSEHRFEAGAAGR